MDPTDSDYCCFALFICFSKKKGMRQCFILSLSTIVDCICNMSMLHCWLLSCFSATRSLQCSLVCSSISAPFPWLSSHVAVLEHLDSVWSQHAPSGCKLGMSWYLILSGCCSCFCTSRHLSHVLEACKYYSPTSGSVPCSEPLRYQCLTQCARWEESVRALPLRSVQISCLDFEVYSSLSYTSPPRTFFPFTSRPNPCVH